MSRYLVFLVLCLATVKSGFSLKCYTSDLTVRPLKLKDLKHELKECNEVINNIRKSQGRSEGNITAELRCYTVTPRGDQDVIIKGCFPRNGCQKLMPNYQKIFKSFQSTVYCAECEEDGCNNVTLDSFNLSDSSAVVNSFKLSDSSAADKVLINFVMSIIITVFLIL